MREFSGGISEASLGTRGLPEIRLIARQDVLVSGYRL
jgi:hypothetical protein